MRHIHFLSEVCEKTNKPALALKFHNGVCLINRTIYNYHMNKKIIAFGIVLLVIASVVFYNLGKMRGVISSESTKTTTQFEPTNTVSVQDSKKEIENVDRYVWEYDKENNESITIEYKKGWSVFSIDGIIRLSPPIPSGVSEYHSDEYIEIFNSDRCPKDTGNNPKFTRCVGTINIQSPSRDINFMKELDFIFNNIK